LKAFLLAAGQGTRLYPLTSKIPKCLVPIRGKPLLGIWIELLLRHGINDILINLHSHGPLVRDYLCREFSRVSIRMFEEPQLLGSAGTIRANRAWIESDPFFWVFYADVLTNTALDRMLAFHNEHSGAATLGVYDTSQPERCGIATTDESHRVLDFVEKPTQPRSRLAFSGLLIGTPALIEALPDFTPADLGFDVLPRLVGRMFAYRIPDFLLDVGTPENYATAQESWPGF